MNAMLPIEKQVDQEDTWTFDWRQEPSILCQEQPALAIYQNPRGQCVIRQEQRWDETEDTVILVCRDNTIKVAHAILDIEFVRPCGGGYEDVAIDTEVPAHDASRSKDRTAAERQRRHRAKLRDSCDSDRDTNRDSPKEAPELRLVAAE